jgi:HPr kinase/phosphorylase
VFTHGLEPTKTFAHLAEDSRCPILQTDLVTSEFIMRLVRALSNVFAERETIHGTLVEVFGIGVLIMGDSGVGKSEAALELVERGHRLVADDAVEVRRVAGDILLGQGANPVLGHHMEIRGLGIINITHLFGVGAIRDSKQVQLVCKLETWDSRKRYDRIGADDTYMDVLDAQVPILEIPVKPGRNIPIIIETAAMNERLKQMGYYSAREFNQNVIRWLDSENARKAYLKREGRSE